MSKNINIILLLVVSFIFLGCQNQPTPSNKSFDKEKIEAIKKVDWSNTLNLKAAVYAANKKFPKKIDNKTTAVKMYAIRKNIMYKYRTTLTKEDFSDEILEIIKIGAKNYLCKENKYEPFLKAGVNFSYIYFDDNDKLLSTLTIRPSDCGYLESNHDLFVKKNKVYKLPSNVGYVRTITKEHENIFKKLKLDCKADESIEWMRPETYVLINQYNKKTKTDSLKLVIEYIKAFKNGTAGCILPYNDEKKSFTDIKDACKTKIKKIANKEYKTTVCFKSSNKKYNKYLVEINEQLVALGTDYEGSIINTIFENKKLFGNCNLKECKISLDGKIIF